MTSVLIAEDHPIFLEGLVRVIGSRPGLSVAGTCGSGDQALSESRRLRPDVLLIDVELRGIDGISVIRSVAGDGLPTKALVVTASRRRNVISDAIQAGASGYLPKSADARTICDAILKIAMGKTVWPPDVQELLAAEIRDRGPSHDSVLTPRELEILKLIADGHSTTEVASRLYLSVATVKTHLHRGFNKLEVNDRAAAVAEALRRGLFD